MNRSGSDPVLLGDLLREYRRASGLTQLELSRRADVSAGAIRDLEQGRTGRPLPGSLAGLARALKLSSAQVAELQRAPVAGGLLVQVLGSLAVWRDAVPVRVAGAARRAVLGLLALSAGRLVHRDAVIDVLWPDDPPGNAVSLVQIQVSRLRRLIDPAAGGVLASAGDSYRLVAGVGELDLVALSELTAQARAACAGGDDEAACGLYEQVVGLWRGEPLADVELLRGHPGVVGLSRQRAEVLVEYGRVASAAGWHGRVLGLLRELAVREPLNEQAHAQLMVALAGSGQQAEALAVYRDLCARLDEELGMPPGAELAGVYQRVLRQDIPAPAERVVVNLPDDGDSGSGGSAAAGSVAGGAARSAPSAVVPRQLPALPGVFVGREPELGALSGLAGRAAAGGTVVISAVGGTAGVGKTTLAVYWAHRVAAEFPGGQLYVNLRGFDPAAAPVSPVEALGWLLEGLGVAAEGMPGSEEARGALFRSLVASRRVLLVLDNARDAEQVRPLLPGAGGCLVLVTSRVQLPGLAVREGAHLLSLDVLSEAEARQMLAARLGVQQAAAEPGAVSQITQLCARLPLALAVAAGRAAARPGLSLGDLAGELAGAASRLDVLQGGDATSSVRAVLSWSQDQLTASAARMFRLLGLHPGPDISVAAAASLAGIPVAEAGQALAELTTVSLLTEHVVGRYAFHDLLRAYAAEQAHAAEDDQPRDAAVGRVLDHYLQNAYAATGLISLSRDPITILPPRPGVIHEYLESHQQALAWLQAEHQVLLAAVTLAASSGSDVHAWQIAWTISDFLYFQGHARELVSIQGTAVSAATRLGDPVGQAVSLRLLAHACARLGDYDQALAHHAASLALYQQLGDRLGEARVHQLLGVVYESQGRYADALGHSEQALRLFQAIGDRRGETLMLNNVGWHHALAEDYRQAREFCQQALTRCTELGLSDVEASAWDSLGYAERHLGNLAKAEACYQRALNRCREFGDRVGEAVVLTHFGDTRHAAGELTDARDTWQLALDILEELHHPDADKVRAKLAGHPATAPAQ
jgi:DNA-binding SARP family transcriptional activator/tetratricopeptide (TPR) repeat protein/DNA-binding XRE family transcriptional regulator